LGSIFKKIGEKFLLHELFLTIFSLFIIRLNYELDLRAGAEKMWRTIYMKSF
jgi:hypothetical protein